MLFELADVRQIPNEGFRRWFRDEQMDLIVWYDEEGGDEIVGFQLCYDKKGHERALTWREGWHYSHHGIDAGEAPFSAKQSPVLVADGYFDQATVAREFTAAAQRIEPALVEFVRARLEKAR